MNEKWRIFNSRGSWKIWGHVGEAIYLITICKMDGLRGRLWAEGITRRFLLKLSPKIAARGLLVHRYMCMIVGTKTGGRVTLNLN